MLLKSIAILAALFVIRYLAKQVLLLGFHKTAFTHWPGPCRSVSPVEHGAEDMVLTKNGLAIITSGIDVAYRGDVTDPRISAAPGKLFAFNFNKPEQNATALEFAIGTDSEFSPHGISIWEEGSETRIFVVNHRQDAETIEIFKLIGDIAKPKIEHIKSVQNPLFTSVNDVLATGPSSFYATNDGYLRFTAWRVLETLLSRPWGSVVHYDGSEAKVVVDSTFEYNGMGLSLDGQFVYIARPFSSSIMIYERSSETNDLAFHQEIAIGALPDNIFVHPVTGDLWSGCTAILHRLLAAFENIDNWAPSLVVRVRPLGTKDHPFEQFKVYDVFSDDGHIMSSSSSAAVVGNGLLIGSVMQKLVYCDMKVDSTLSRDTY
ncbi:serum paraoxonase/arylesterase 2-like [Apostichopus japonicus]|uniref:serum paraoxonase/arylesterase 2-like n=1 Tax=Stichopus japonicus TaxID=307972 RepID=UPI003AB54483